MSLGLRPLWLPPGEEAVIGPDGRPLPTPPTDAAPPPLPVDGPPAPPDYQPPDLLSAPPPGFRERLAAALAATPAYQPTRGSTGAQAFFGGLLSGGARGFAASGATKAKAAEVERERANTVRKAEADRNYANALETWKARLTSYYRTKADERGKVLVTKDMAEAMGAPAAAGSYRDPIEVGTKIRERQSVARVPKELASTLGMEPGAETTPGTILEARRLLAPPKNQANVGSTVISPRAQSIIDGIKSGKLRPDIVRSLPPRDPVRSEVIQGLADAGVDVNTMQYDIAAETSYWRTQNDSKRTSMRTLLNTLEHSIPYTRQLIKDLRSSVPDFAISGINRAQLAVVANSRGPDAVLARKLVAQISDIGAEIGGLYMGGNSNTDESFRVAQQNINSNWTEEALLGALDQIEVNAGIRKRAMDDVVPRTRTGESASKAKPRTFIPDGGQ